MLSRDPALCKGGLRPEGGGTWLVGRDTWPANPRHVVPRSFFHVVRLWNRCRAGMGGFAVLPEPGGVNQQPAWLMAAFAVLDAEDERIREAEKGEG